MPYYKPLSVVPIDEFTPSYDWRVLGDLLDLPYLDFFPDLDSIGADELDIMHCTGFVIIPFAIKISNTILHYLAFSYASWEFSISN